MDRHPTIRLAKGRDRSLRRRHPWIYSGAIGAVDGEPASGDVVRVADHRDSFLAWAYFNKASKLQARVLDWNEAASIDAEWWRSRVRESLDRRKGIPGLDGTDVYRAVYAEADCLPGLIVDRYGPSLAVQTLSYGMDRRLPIILDVLEDLLHPGGIVERNESPLRTLEALPQRSGILRGAAPPLEIVEHGIRYLVDPLRGQKTGFFLDQRENRAAVRVVARGARVLDCFCNDGGFALNAAAAGATDVLGLDASPEAVGTAADNVRRNGCTNVRFEQADVFDRLRSLKEEGAAWDVIVLDPPSFTRSRKTVPVARKGYRQLHALAFALLAPDGFLLTASCSHHITAEAFRDDIVRSAERAGRSLQLLDWRGAAPDHPTLPAVPETAYLKFGVFRVI